MYDIRKISDDIFCNKCGSKQPSGSLFCDKCGNKLTIDTGNSNAISNNNLTTSNPFASLNPFSNNSFADLTQPSNANLPQWNNAFVKRNADDYQSVNTPIKSNHSSYKSDYIDTPITKQTIYNDWQESDSSASQSVADLSSNFTIPDFMDFILCPAGSFMMSTTDDDEIQNRVEIPKLFYIGKYPVTQLQYKIIVDKNYSEFSGDNNPVENVSLGKAKKFCIKLNTKYKNFLPLGYKFDLPTEVQWEYACRAGTVTSLNNSKNITTKEGMCENLNEVAWYNKNSDSKTHPVGLKRPNAWGIYDMHGNVWEWCNNKDESGSYILRGGSWDDNAEDCSSNSKSYEYPMNSFNTIGFRVAIVPAE